MWVFVLVALFIVIASVSFQSYIVSEVEGIGFKVFTFLVNAFMGTIGLSLVSFIPFSTNSADGVAESVTGLFIAIVSISSYYGILLIALIVQLLRNARKKRKIKNDSVSSL